MSNSDLAAVIQETALIDHHVHSVLEREVDPADFELLLTEGSEAAPAGTSHLDSQVGFALRRHCAPRLGLAPHATTAEYLEARSALGPAEVNRRLLRQNALAASLIDTGVVGGESQLASLPRFAELGAHQAYEIVRLETLAESVLARVSDREFPDAFREALARATRSAVGLKSIIAYRFGFDFDPERPTDADTRAALARLAPEARTRLADPCLLRFVLWCGIDTGLPLQLHAGYGDADLDIARCNPALLMPWLRSLPAQASPIMLLHCYPYHREAGYLAQVFPGVYFDLGLGINYTGAAATHLIRSGFELAPFSKLLYSSDAWGLAELHMLGATLWRDGLTRALGEFVARGEWAEHEAVRVAQLVCEGNARRVYGLHP